MDNYIFFSQKKWRLDIIFLAGAIATEL